MKRGPYKKYLSDSNHPIPKQTRYNWAREVPDEINSSTHSSQVTHIGEPLSADGNHHAETMNASRCSSESDSTDHFLSSEEDNEGTTSEEDRDSSESESSSGTNDFAEENIADFEKWQVPLYSGSRIPLLHALLMISSFVSRFYLTNDALHCLLGILKILLPSDSKLPNTTYLFKKFMPSCNSEMRFYCSLCGENLQSNNDIFKCDCSDKELTAADLIQNGDYYFLLSMADQLKCLLQDCQLGKNLKLHSPDDRHNLTFNICDIYDGRMYRQFGDGKLYDRYSLSLQMNTDGVPTSKSSNCSIWPVQCIINELPLEMRKRHHILSSLWFGTGKPNMNGILRGFVEELKELSSNGFRWILNGKPIISRVYLLAVCVDSVARACVQNFVQFNGFFGCSWCEHPGKFEINSTIYEYREICVRRDKESVSHYARQAKDLGYPFKGVQDFSALSELPYFDIVNGMVVDSMHCVDLGVMRQLAKLWFRSKYSGSAWYIGLHTQDIDKKLKNIKPPTNLTRLPRSVHSLKHWKASEWRNFLLYYGPFVLKGTLPSRYYKHFLLLSNAIYLLNQITITQEELFIARQKINLFVKRFQKYYGIVNMSFNVHQLMHVADCVSQWGPLWVYSAYGFENHSGQLVKMFNGTQHIGTQITTHFRHVQQLKAITALVSNTDCEHYADFVALQNRLFDYYAPTKKVVRSGDHIVFIGNGNRREHVPQFDGLYFNRVLIDNEIYSIDSYKQMAKRKNSLLFLSKNKIVKLTAIGLIDGRAVLFGRLAEIRNLTCDVNNKMQLLSVIRYSEYVYFSPSSIVSKCAFLQSPNGTYLSVLCNLHDRD